MKKVFLLSIFTVVLSIHTYADNSFERTENNNSNLFAKEMFLVNVEFESDLITSCMDVAIAYANAQLDAGHITAGQWFGVVNATLAVCNLGYN